MSELWLPVVGYEGIYEISNRGSLRRIAPGTRGAGKIGMLKGDKPKGYVRHRLFREGRFKRMQAHQIVMAAFVGPVPPEHEVNHLNGIHDDNRWPENLKYVTRSENQAHKYRELGWKGRAGSKHHYAKINEADVIEMRRLRSEGFELKELAAKYGVCTGSVSLICKRRTWRHC